MSCSCAQCGEPLLAAAPRAAATGEADASASGHASCCADLKSAVLAPPAASRRGGGRSGVALVNDDDREAQVFPIVFGGNLLPRGEEIGVDVRLLGIALAVSVVATLVFGLLPALHLSRTNQLDALGSRGAATTTRDTRVRMLLVVGELAMATILLVGAGLLTTSFQPRQRWTRAIDPTNVLAFQLVLPGEYPTARKAESIERSWRRCVRTGLTVAGLRMPASDRRSDTVGSFVPPGRTLDAVAKEAERPRLKSSAPGI